MLDGSIGDAGSIAIDLDLIVLMDANKAVLACRGGYYTHTFFSSAEFHKMKALWLRTKKIERVEKRTCVGCKHGKHVDNEDGFRHRCLLQEGKALEVAVERDAGCPLGEYV